MSASTLTPDGITGTTVASVAPVVLPATDRPVELQVRVSAPTTGGELPIILMSHGLGHSNNLSSMNGYAPLVTRWAAAGFAVIQPTHLDSRTLNRDHPVPEDIPHWRSRVSDMVSIIDHLDAIEAAVPALRGRLDRDRIAIAGHSMGGHTASLLLGARLTDPRDGSTTQLADPRIRAGVLLAAPGRGGDALTSFMAETYPYFSTTDFSTMTAPALVVAGDKDASTHLTVLGPQWHIDPYSLAPQPKSLLTLFDAEHGLGGIAGYDVAETTDENPERVTLLAHLTSAYLRSELHPGDPSWQQARDALATAPDPLGRIESK